MNQNFYSGFQNMSTPLSSPSSNNPNPPSSNEYKSPKKNNTGMIIAIVLAVVAIIAIATGCILMFSGSSKSEPKQNGNNKKEEKIKAITYLNSENKSKDSIFFNLEPSNTGNGVLIGIKDTDVASNFILGEEVYNNVLSIDDYDEELLSFGYNDDYFNFEIEEGIYFHDKEEYDDYEIVHTDDKFFVIEDNTGTYFIYYVFDESQYDNSETDKYWDTLRILSSDSLSEAKQKISSIRETFDICVYDIEEGFDNCITEDDEKIDYKEYRYIKDILVDSLIDYNLYVNSYEEISGVDAEDIDVSMDMKFDDMEEASYTSFSISFNDYEYNKEIYKDEFKLNGMDVVIRIHNSTCAAAIAQKDGHVNIYVHLPSGAEENVENVQKALVSAFSKTK